MEEQTWKFGFSDVRLMPGEQIGLHKQDTWEISYIITGSGMRLIGDRTEPFESGEIVFIPPDIPHCWRFDNTSVDADGRISNISLFFGGEFLDRCASVFPNMQDMVGRLRTLDHAVSLSGKKREAAGELLLRMREEDEEDRLVSLLRLILILSRPGRESEVGRRQEENLSQKRMDDIRTYVICNADRRIALDEVARHVGMNRSSFCIFFKKETGRTFIDFLNGYRISLACKYLRDTDSQVADICFRAGFESVPYFNRVFSNVMGCTPTEYRRRQS